MAGRSVIRTAPPLVVAMLATAAAIVGAVGVAAPVGAHSDQGDLRIVGIQLGSEEHQVRVSAEYRYDDEHAVYRDGTLRLSGTSSEGVTLIPETFSRTDVDGLYAVDVVLPPPGTWTLRVAGNAPAATAEVSFDTAEPEWLEPGDGAGAPTSSSSGVDVRWDWMLLGLAAVSGWFLVLRWRRRSARGALSDPW